MGGRWDNLRWQRTVPDLRDRMRKAVDLGSATPSMLTRAARMAYGSISGNEEAFKASKEAVYGKGA